MIYWGWIDYFMYRRILLDHSCNCFGAGGPSLRSQTRIMTAEYSRFFHHERLKKVFFLTVKDDQTVTLQYTGMHSSLLITEIFQNILDILIMEGAEGTIASLARTCRTFHDASLDILWFEQLGLLHLVRCMPSDLWVESEGIVVRMIVDFSY